MVNRSSTQSTLPFTYLSQPFLSRFAAQEYTANNVSVYRLRDVPIEPRAASNLLSNPGFELIDESRYPAGWVPIAESGSSRIDCGKGHRARLVAVRSKLLTTVLGQIQIGRAYYYCAQCGQGVIPKDRELDIVNTSLSPGVRRMIGLVGWKEPFNEGRADLQELAGVCVSTKAVERASEAIGEDIEASAKPDRELVVSGKIVALERKRNPIVRMYIAMDGTGVPVLPSETVGRKGKDETGEAKTREARLGCVFTQTRIDDSGEPVRDGDSTTYVGAIESAEEFGPRIYAEAVRRGVRDAGEAVVLGDGAPWIWTIADMHFYGAIQILDLYHALDHVTVRRRKPRYR